MEAAKSLTISFGTRTARLQPGYGHLSGILGIDGQERLTKNSSAIYTSRRPVRKNMVRRTNLNEKLRRMRQYVN